MGLILEDFGRGAGAGRRRDPVVHFYETFLSETRTLLAPIESLIADHDGWPLH